MPHPLSIVVVLLCGLTGTIEAKTTVRVHLIDDATGQTVPAMVCISDDDGKVHIPPHGEIVETHRMSRIDDFKHGISFDSDPNWIGPVQIMQGVSWKHGRVDPYDRAPSLPYWHEPASYQTSGDFTISLAEGGWRLAVDHGVEYIPVTKNFELNGEEERTIRIRLKRWINMPEQGWWSGDVHVHHPTEKSEHREFLLQNARAVDLHVVNVLAMGHHKGIDFPQEGFGKKFRTQRDDYALVSGQEDPRSTFGHIIGLNLTKMVRDLTTYDLYDEVFHGIHQQHNALVGYAHFSWNGCELPRGFPWYVTTEDLDFIELMQFSKINETDYYDYLNLGFQLTAAAGSDIPWGSVMGEVRTYVKSGPKLDIDRWFQGLKRGNTFVTNGPMLEFTVDGQLPGSRIEKTAGETLRIVGHVFGHPRIGIPTSLTLISNEGVLQTVQNLDNRTELHLEFEPTLLQSRWFLLAAHCDNGSLALTTPVYAIVDGRKHWCAERGPAIIRKKQEAIASIEQEFIDDLSPQGRGIVLRLAKARQYYRELLREMQEAPQLDETPSTFPKD